MKRSFLAFALLPLLFIVGCNAQVTAINVSNVIKSVLNIAKDEVPQFPAADQPIATNFINLGYTLDAQVDTCVGSVGNKKTKILSCFNTFAAGLLSPTELVQLRILSPKAQSRVTLYATAAVIAINGIEAAWGGTPVAQPVIGTPPTAAELRRFANQVQNVNPSAGDLVAWADLR